MKLIAKHVTFSGRVQGVGFRFTALNVANRYSLTGYVRNLPDGGVEMLMQGQPDMIDDCIRDLRESFAGYVGDTDAKEMPYDPSLTDFKINF
jgi:acylphosphatase